MNGRVLEPVVEGEPAVAVGDAVAGGVGADAHPDRPATASDAASDNLSMHRFHRGTDVTSIRHVVVWIVSYVFDGSSMRSRICRCSGSRARCCSI